MSKRLFEPEIKYLEGNALVPAKALCYKKDKDGGVIERVKARTHEFENSLKENLEKELAGVEIFPTKDYVFISITHGLNSSSEYKKLDLDNRAKTILDALKGVVYEDDSQVKVLLTDKIFLENAQESYYSIRIKILDKDIEKRLYKYLSRVCGQKYI